MKPTADDDMILTGEEAVDQMIETWNDVGMGKVEIESAGNWFIIRRSGGGFSTFLSLVDGTAVTITDCEATTRHIPKGLRPEGSVNEEDHSTLVTAFKNAGIGSYPLEDEGVFRFGYSHHGMHREVLIGLTTDRFEVRDR